MDTNIFVSGIHWNGASAAVLALWQENCFELLMSESILSELLRVLRSFKLELAAHRLVWWEQQIRAGALFVKTVETIQACADPDDDKFLEAAIAGGAQYIVTQDKHLLVMDGFRGIRIVSPDDFAFLLYWW